MYPRIYRPEPTVQLLGSLFVLLFSIFAIFVITRPGKHVDIAAKVILFGVSAFFAFFFLYLKTTEIILFEDAIEKTTWFSHRRLNRDEILGWHGEFHRAYSYILVPRDRKVRNMRLPPLFRWDKTFFDWKRSIPHLKK